MQDADAAAAVGRLDGLVVTGGADVDPGRYGAQPHPRTVTWRTDRDTWELALLEAADARGLPVLGICRGMQVMAVHAGGTLDQHLPDVVGHEEHSPGGDAFGDVDVETCPGTRLRLLVGERGSVGCHHHQSVREHPGFESRGVRRATARSRRWRPPGDRFVVAVQWHPETRADAGLFAGLVAAAVQA